MKDKKKGDVDEGRQKRYTTKIEDKEKKEEK